MHFNDYQKQALAINIAATTEFRECAQHAFGLAEESGEVLALFKRCIRDQDETLSCIDRTELSKELGDALWQIAAIAYDFDISLDDIASENLAKLEERKETSTLHDKGRA